MADDDKGLGLGTAVGVGAITAAGAAGAALANGAFATREEGVKNSAKAVTETAKKLHEEWGKIKDLTPEEKAIFDTHVNNAVALSTAEHPLTHSYVSRNLKALKEAAPDAEKKAIDSLLVKLEPIKAVEKSASKAIGGQMATEGLAEAWKEASWVERLEGSIAHSPKKIALIAAPVIAAGAYLSINALSGKDKSALNGNGQAKA